MHTVILIKHSLPEVVPGVAARHWQLSAEGRRRCDTLAEQLAVYQPVAIWHSYEPKAAETAGMVAARLGVVATPANDLHEHVRTSGDWRAPDAFQAAVAQFFAEPERLVFGQETAAAALRRFAAAVDAVLGQVPGETVAIVAHGTVISLLVAARARVDGFGLWQGLGLPSFVVCSLPTWAITTRWVVGEPIG